MVAIVFWGLDCREKLSLSDRIANRVQNSLTGKVWGRSERPQFVYLFQSERDLHGTEQECKGCLLEQALGAHCEHLISAGYDVTRLQQNTQRKRKVVSLGAHAAESGRDAAKDADVGSLPWLVIQLMLMFTWHQMVLSVAKMGAYPLI